MGREGKAGGEEGRGMGGIGEGRGMVGLQAKAWPPISWRWRRKFFISSLQDFSKIGPLMENGLCDCDCGSVGVVSVDIDECAINQCGNHADCTNWPGSYRCICHVGFQKNATRCTGQIHYHNLLYIDWCRGQH